MISTTYDPEADALYVRIASKDTAVSETREIEPGVLLDIDADGRVIGIEILSARVHSAAQSL